MKTIYDLELHEELYTNNVIVVRVPGGWIYHYGAKSNFVPYNVEFDPKYMPDFEDLDGRIQNPKDYFSEDPPEDTLP